MENQDLTTEDFNLDEAGLVINKNDGAYPNSGQILIMAGGAGSGKSFILDKLLLFNGKLFNPDDTLGLLLRFGKKYPNSNLAKKFQDKKGKSLKDIDLTNSSDANLVYEFIAEFKLHREKEACFFKAVQNEKEKPNVIFDIQMKDLKNIEYISNYAKMGGYSPENIHIVWVLNDVKIALDQNAKRHRVVDTEFLKQSHIGAATTFKNLIDYSEQWQKTVNGDIWIVFNKRGIDVKTVVTISRMSDVDADDDNSKFKLNIGIDNSEKHPYFAVHMKERGKTAKSWDSVGKAVLNKIKDYVPDKAKDMFKEDKEQIDEVSFDELKKDKNANLYFHAITNEEFKKIYPPSLERPFFVTNSLQVAKRYAGYNDSGSIKICILRLKNENFFNFFKKSDLLKLFDKELTEAFYDEIRNINTLMDFSETVGFVLKDNFNVFANLIKAVSKNKNILNSEDALDKYFRKLKSTDKYDCSMNLFKVIAYLTTEFKEDFLSKKILKLEYSMNIRRYIKKWMFKLVYDKTNYRLVGEKDTSKDTFASGLAFKEFAVIDISVIKDIYPLIVDVSEVSKIVKQLKV